MKNKIWAHGLFLITLLLFSPFAVIGAICLNIHFFFDLGYELAAEANDKAAKIIRKN